MNDSTARRELLKGIAAVGAASFCGVGVHAASGKSKYDPTAKFELKVVEVDMRRNSAGRMLKARIYQPAGPGPFPVLLDLHGGAWNFKDRFAEEPMDRAIASSGVLVVAIDLTVAPEAPYPANVQDANYGVRWLKAHASKWNGDASKVGVFGSSSGGYIAILLGMRPRDKRYNSIPLTEAPKLDATIAYAAMRAPISNPLARFDNAKAIDRDTMVQYSKTYFDPWEGITESGPQQILDRREKVSLPPLLIMQGELDDNVLPEVQAKFAKSYNAAGGRCDYEVFPNSVHQWTAREGVQTERARAMVRNFIAKNVNR